MPLLHSLYRAGAVATDIPSSEKEGRAGSVHKDRMDEFLFGGTVTDKSDAAAKTFVIAVLFKLDKIC